MVVDTPAAAPPLRLLERPPRLRRRAAVPARPAPWWAHWIDRLVRKAR